MSKKAKKLTSRCPFCDGSMEITRLHCRSCDTQIDSPLAIPPFFRLPQDLQDLVLVFLRCRGNIREVEKELGISYPTVCKRLDLINEILSGAVSSAPATPPPSTANAAERERILELVENGTITAGEAAQRLKNL